MAWIGRSRWRRRSVNELTSMSTLATQMEGFVCRNIGSGCEWLMKGPCMSFLHWHFPGRTWKLELIEDTTTSTLMLFDFSKVYMMQATKLLTYMLPALMTTTTTKISTWCRHATPEAVANQLKPKRSRRKLKPNIKYIGPESEGADWLPVPRLSQAAGMQSVLV